MVNSIMVLLKFAVLILSSYLIGAIPFGIVVSKLSRGMDIRGYGSGRIGATNVIRTAGGRAGVLTMVLDVAKGSVAVVIAWCLLHTPVAQVVAAMSAMIGHNWSVYIKFQGGRGVATFVGGLAAMYWPVGLGVSAIVLSVAALSRYMSLGSILGTVTAFLTMLSLVILEKQPVAYLIYCGLAGCMILFQHRDNIRRLCAGNERKLGEKAEVRETERGSAGNEHGNSD